MFSQAVREMTDNKFQIQVFAPNEIVGGLQAMDAVANGTVEACHTASYYYWGKDPTFAMATAIPFGLNYRMQNAWMYEGGGIELMNDFYKKFNIYGLPGGNSGAQMGGWYKKEINSAEDWKGLKIRIGGYGGATMQRLGAVPQQIAAGEVYQALEKGTIDACEWVGPYDDEKLGFQRVAQQLLLSRLVGGAGDAPPVLQSRQMERRCRKPIKPIVKSAAQTANIVMTARYDMLNPASLRKLVQSGAVLKPFSEEVLDACFKASNAVNDEFAAKNADFKKAYEAMKAVRGEGYLWFQLSEHTSDTYMMIQQRKRML